MTIPPFSSVQQLILMDTMPWDAGDPVPHGAGGLSDEDRAGVLMVLDPTTMQALWAIEQGLQSEETEREALARLTKTRAARQAARQNALLKASEAMEPSAEPPALPADWAAPIDAARVAEVAKQLFTRVMSR